MTTGYRYQDYRMGGSVPGVFDPNAGDVFTVLDWMLTSGSNPWTKTNIGTNIEEYQAPGGSQVKMTVYDEYPMTGGTNSYHSLVRATVGATTFPTPTQEATSGYGGVHIVKRYGSTALGWIGMRTDRLFMMMTTGTVSNAPDNLLVVGDLPTLDPSDPGLCIVAGRLGTGLYPSISTSANVSNLAMTTSSAVFTGYSLNNKANNVSSCPLFFRADLGALSNGSKNVADYAGGFPLIPYYVLTSDTQLSSGYSTLRGKLPWWYAVPFGTGATFINNVTASGDTFAIGAAEFELMEFGAITYPGCFMYTDGENLP